MTTSGIPFGKNRSMNGMNITSTGFAPYSDDELAAMMADVESDLVERKESLRGDAPVKIRQAVCAFANDLPDHGRPGVVFVGLSRRVRAVFSGSPEPNSATALRIRRSAGAPSRTSCGGSTTSSSHTTAQPSISCPGPSRSATRPTPWTPYSSSCETPSCTGPTKTRTRPRSELVRRSHRDRQSRRSVRRGQRRELRGSRGSSIIGIRFSPRRCACFGLVQRYGFGIPGGGLARPPPQEAAVVDHVLQIPRPGPIIPADPAVPPPPCARPDSKTAGSRPPRAAAATRTQGSATARRRGPCAPGSGSDSPARRRRDQGRAAAEKRGIERWPDAVPPQNALRRARPRA